MARPRNLDNLPAQPNVDETAVNQAFAVARLPEATAETTELVALFSYEGAVTIDAVQEQCRVGLRRTAEGMLQMGASLAILKSLTPHGEFSDRVEAMGLSARRAQEYMAAAVRFAKSAESALLLRSGNPAKLLELLSADDATLGLLQQSGKLDKLETMTASELRALVRARDDEAQVAKDRSDRQQARLDKMALDLRALKRLQPDERLAKMQAELTSVATAGYSWAVASLRPAFEQLTAHYIEHGGDDSKIPMAAALAQVQRELTALRNEFALPDVSNAADQALADEVAQWGGKPQ